MVKDLILEKLKNTDGFVSGEELSQCFDISRTAIWKHIKCLREDGFVIKAVTNKGYILENKEHIRFCEYEIKKLLDTRFLGGKIIILDKVDSTNEHIKKYLEQSGTVVISKEQTNGRAKNKNKFISTQEGLYLSVLYNPMAMSIDILKKLKNGIVESVRETFAKSLDITIVDNEIFKGNQKVGGILTQIEIESESEKVQSIIVGFGVYKNVYNTDENKVKLTACVLNRLDNLFVKLDSIKE